MIRHFLYSIDNSKVFFLFLLQKNIENLEIFYKLKSEIKNFIKKLISTVFICGEIARNTTKNLTENKNNKKKKEKKTQLKPCHYMFDDKHEARIATTKKAFFFYYLCI